MTLKKKDFARVGTSIFLHELTDSPAIDRVCDLVDLA